MDAAVWAVVQSIKLIPLGEWALRPNGDIGGFPSGHTTHAFAMAFALTTYFPRFGWFWYLCAGIIAWSRVESAWHTPLQVTGGVFFGIAFGVTFINYLFKKYAGSQHAAKQA
jgi:membrane-associated phospholipid phosphatase